ncbi:hypothetical protein MKZ38_002541 [Zalerion maritima]|uniref:Uncharacterized protein n=1 Tax=Zalerion maritima TaxID=339359 RepID=A0AAD5RNV0_9PEZI|nr:hypothetical protein MKZ38_002541 [Zalerion maritima]
MDNMLIYIAEVVGVISGLLSNYLPKVVAYISWAGHAFLYSILPSIWSHTYDFVLYASPRLVVALRQIAVFLTSLILILWNGIPILFRTAYNITQTVFPAIHTVVTKISSFIVQIIDSIFTVLFWPARVFLLPVWGIYSKIASIMFLLKPIMDFLMYGAIFGLLCGVTIFLAASAIFFILGLTESPPKQYEHEPAMKKRKGKTPIPALTVKVKREEEPLLVQDIYGVGSSSGNSPRPARALSQATTTYARTVPPALLAATPSSEESTAQQRPESRKERGRPVTQTQPQPRTATRPANPTRQLERPKLKLERPNSRGHCGAGAGPAARAASTAPFSKSKPKSIKDTAAVMPLTHLIASFSILVLFRRYTSFVFFVAATQTSTATATTATRTKWAASAKTAIAKPESKSELYPFAFYPIAYQYHHLRRYHKRNMRSQRLQRQTW